MRPAGIVLTALLAVAGLPPSGSASGAPLPGSDDGSAAIRTDIASLAALGTEVPGDYDGPSPTALVRRLLDRKERAVRPLLKEAWERAGERNAGARWRDAGLERVILFLYGREATEKKVDPDRISFGGTRGAVYEREGIVLVRPGGSGERPRVMGEPGWDGEDEEPRPKFEALIRGGKFRRAARPDLRALLAFLDDGTFAAWSDSEKRAYVLGFGEACASDPGFRPRLLERCEAAPTDSWLTAAAAAAGTPDAVAILRARIAPFASRVAEGREATVPYLRAAVRGLRRCAPDALREEIGKLEGRNREAALEGAGFAVASGFLCDDLDAAAEGARRRPLAAMIHAILRAGIMRELPGPEAMPRVVRALAAALEGKDAEVAEGARRAAYVLFYAGWRDGTADLNFSSNDVKVEGTGDRLGPYPDEGTILLRLREDLEKGALVFTDDADGFLDAPTPALALGRSSVGISGFESPIPNMAGPDRTCPVTVKAEPTAEGLRVTLGNRGTKPWALLPTAFRYVTAEFIPVKVTGRPGGPKEFTELALSFGDLGGWARWTAPATDLVKVEPGGEYAFDVAVRPEHREADHVSVSLHLQFRIPAGSDLPLLKMLGDTWVR